jgi:hypothetical protein
MRKFLPVLYGLALIASVIATRHFNTAARHYRVSEMPEVENTASKNYWEYLRLRDPKTGEIPRGIHARELAFARTLVPRSMNTIATSTPTIHTTGWNSAGPYNTGGRTQAVAIDIADEANVVIATAQGGIWRSVDSGMTWTRATAPDEMKNTVSLVQDHRIGRTNVWYAGTGELLSTTNRRVTITGPPRWRTRDVGDGIFKSTDNGKSWFLLPSTHDATEVDLDSTFDGVWNVVVDNSNTEADVVYAAGFGAIMRSADGGATWSNVLGDVTHRSYCSDVQITSTGVLYAYLSQYSIDNTKPPTAGVWRSTDGIHWTNITPTSWPRRTQRLKIAIAPSNENILYVAGSNDSAGLNPIMFKYTYVSGDGSGAGGNWQDRSGNLPLPVEDASGLSTLAGYCLALRVLPSNPDVVFIGGTNLFRSTDGFATQNNTDWIGGYNPDQSQSQSYPNTHPDHHDLAFSYSDPLKMFAVNDNGIYLTRDCTATNAPTYPVDWENRNTGDVASIIYNVAINKYRTGDTTVIGGFQDQGSWYDSTNALGQWQQVGGGDGCYCAMNNNSVISTSQFGNAYRLSLDSEIWWYVKPPVGNDPQFVTPFMLDPTDQSQFYFAVNNDIWRNDDLDAIEPMTYSPSTATWTQLQNCSIGSSSYITALAMSVVPAHSLYMGSSDGHVYRVKSVNGVTQSKEDISGSNLPKDAFISCVCVDPENAQNIIACFSNYHVISLFATSDGGTNWRNVSGNLEQNPDGSGDGPSTRWVSIVHQNGQTIYLCATSVGMFSTDNISGSVTWAPEGLATIGRVICENIDVRESDGFVAVATQGGGVYTTHIVAEQQQQNNGVSDAGSDIGSFTINPNPINSRASVSLSLARSEHVKLAVINATGRRSEDIYDGIVNSGSATFNLDASRLPSGTYYVELITDQAVETRRVVVHH